jgi:hypothetical protein
MGAGDLNLKKSWHPNTFRNQALVWEKEQARDVETRKIEQMKKELQEERDREELYRLHNQGKNRYVWKENIPARKIVVEVHIFIPCGVDRLIIDVVYFMIFFNLESC